jgi:tRNA-modifying protein YgfZ
LSATAELYRQFRERGGIVDLADRLKLLFTGADRARYLNGQVTANVASAKTPSVFPACVTTAKGKLCGDVMVSVGPGGILLDADPTLAESLPARMEKYIIADDVAVEDATEKVAIIHLVGMPLEAIPEIARPSLVASNRFGVAGWDLFPPFRQDLSKFWDPLAAAFPVLTPEILEIIRTEHGVPHWGAELTPDTLPAEAGLDRTHIDFHKGCYIGQEVISRIKSVGHVNRQLSGFISTNGSLLAAPARIFTADQPEKDWGQLTSATWSFALDQSIALGYLRRGAPVEGLLATSEDAPDAPVPIVPHTLPFLT